jgi:hypothetical protein
MANENKDRKTNRRNFLSGIATAALGITVLPGSNQIKSKNKLEGLKNILNENSLPVYNICNYGATGDGKTLNTKAIQLLIDTCSDNGGGTVFFPPGNYLTGSLQIRDNVNLYLSVGATVWGSPNLSDYSNSCLIYAEDATNISITGRGTINGNGKSFWGKFYDDHFKKTGSWNSDIYGILKRPGRLLKFLRCRNLLIEGITIENSPAWTIHPIDCERVTITGISILTGTYEEHGPNTDGIDPDGCSQVRISDCYIQSGDDCIVLKITDREGGRKICRDVVVTNCILETKQTALKIGSETHGEFRNIVFSNCTIHQAGNGFGLWMMDGGVIDGLVVNNITMDTGRIKNCQGMFIWSHRRKEDTAWGTIRNVLVSNVTIYGAGGIYVSGAREKYIEGVVFDTIRMNINDGRYTKYHDDPPYPTPYLFSYRVAPYDIFCRYANDIKFRNVQLAWDGPEKPDRGSAMRCFHVNSLEIAGFSGRQSLNSNASAIHLKDVNGVFMHGCQSPEQTTTAVFFDEGVKKAALVGNDFSRAEEFYVLHESVDPAEIFQTGNHLPY